MSAAVHFPKRSILGLGRAGMDLYPEPVGVKTEEANQYYACLGGSTANICVALTRQGVETSLATAVSDDAIGRFVLNELDKYGIQRNYVAIANGQDIRTSLAVVESRIEDHQSVIYRNNAADFYHDAQHVEQIDYSRMPYQ